MATRRMFSKVIVDSDDFLDMPISARLLYYDLGMRADDDGFVNPKRVMRICGASDDDLKILLLKNYVLNFENKVLVIRDWKVNNFIRADRYTPTIYKKYLEKLQVLSTKQYIVSSGIPNDIPVVDPGKVSIGKVSKDSPAVKLNQPFPKPTNQQKKGLVLLRTKLLEIDKKFDLYTYMAAINKKAGYFPPVDSIINIATSAIDNNKTKLWGYFTNALKQEFPKRFADLNIQEHNKYKNEPVVMKEIFNNY